MSSGRGNRVTIAMQIPRRRRLPALRARIPHAISISHRYLDIPLDAVFRDAYTIIAKLVSLHEWTKRYGWTERLRDLVVALRMLCENNIIRIAS